MLSHVIRDSDVQYHNAVSHGFFGVVNDSRHRRVATRFAQDWVSESSRVKTAAEGPRAFSRPLRDGAGR